MDRLQVAARFTAFVWCLRTNKQTVTEEAVRFAKENWIAFLPAAHEGLGKLLIGIATADTGRPARQNRQRRSAGGTKVPKRKLAFFRTPTSLSDKLPLIARECKPRLWSEA